MRPEERDAAYLWDMLQAAREVESIVEDHDMTSFLDNLIFVRAIERGVEHIGGRRLSVCRDPIWKPTLKFLGGR